MDMVGNRRQMGWRQQVCTYVFDRESNFDKFTMVFEMANCGLSNVDLGYTRTVVNVFKSYYPNTVNYMLIYDLPWVLNGKLIKFSTYTPSPHFNHCILFPWLFVSRRPDENHPLVYATENGRRHAQRERQVTVRIHTKG